MILIIIAAAIFIAGMVTGAGLLLLWFMWTEAHDGYNEDVRQAKREGYDWS